MAKIRAVLYRQEILRCADALSVPGCCELSESIAHRQIGRLTSVWSTTLHGSGNRVHKKRPPALS